MAHLHAQEEASRKGGHAEKPFAYTAPVDAYPWVTGDPTSTARDSYTAALGNLIPANQGPWAREQAVFTSALAEMTTTSTSSLPGMSFFPSTRTTRSYRSARTQAKPVKTGSSLSPPVSMRSSPPSTIILGAKSPRSPMLRRGSSRLRAWATSCR